MGPGNEAERMREEESKGSLMIDDITIPNSTPQPSGAQFPVKLLPQFLPGNKLPFSISFPSVFGVLQLSTVQAPLHLAPLYIPTSHAVTFTFRLNGSKPNEIMPQRPQEATDGHSVAFKADIPRFEN